MPFADHQLSFRQRRRLKIAAAATAAFGTASLAAAPDAIVTGMAIGALTTIWRVWQVRHDDPRDGWAA